MKADTIQAIKGDVLVSRDDWEHLIRKSERYDIQYNTLKRTLTQTIKQQYADEIADLKSQIKDLNHKNKNLELDLQQKTIKYEDIKIGRTMSLILNAIFIGLFTYLIMA